MEELQHKKLPHDIRVQLRFFDAFSEKTSYYQEFLEVEAQRYYNLVCREMEAKQDEDIKKLVVEEVLTDFIPAFLRDLNSEIKRLGLAESDVDPESTNNKLDHEEQAETAFVLMLLKYQTIRLYHAIRISYGYYYKGALLKPEQLHLHYFREKPPKPEIIVMPALNEEPEKTKAAKSIVSDDTTFRYKYYDTDRLEELTYLKKELIQKGRISKETTLKQFRNIFSGQPLLKPVHWTGNKSELYYMIYLLFNQTAVMEDLHNEHWKVACNCFVQHDGTPYDPQNLKEQKKPKSTFRIIEKMVNTMK